MNKCIALILASINLQLCFMVELAKAENLPQWFVGACFDTYEEAISKLKQVKAYESRFDKNSGRNLKGEVVFHDAYANDFEKGFPANAPISIKFLMVGYGASNMLNSPALLEAISKKLINNCKPVSKVVFVDRCQPFAQFGCKPSKGFYWEVNSKKIQPINWYTSAPDLICAEKISQWKYEGWCD